MFYEAPFTDKFLRYLSIHFDSVGLAIGIGLILVAHDWVWDGIPGIIGSSTSRCI
jgi:hypothetical protein